MTELRTTKTIAARMRELYRKVGELEPGDLAFEPSLDSAWESMGVPLTAILDEVVAHLRELESLHDGGPGLDSKSDDGWELSFDEPGKVTGAEAVLEPSSMDERLARQVADTCFTATHELQQAQRRLRAGRRGHVELMEACEHVCRKLRRAIAAVNAAVERREGLEPQLADEEAAQLDSAIAVRQMYAKFRRSLIACGESNPELVRKAVRFAAVSLAVLIGSDAYADVRLADRRLLGSLQRRIFAWVREQQGEAEGRRLHRDLCNAADLLRGINLRQELQVHDAELAANALASAGGPELLERERFREWVAPLRPLAGRDDELDELVARAVAGASPAELLEPLCVALHRIRRSAGSTA